MTPLLFLFFYPGVPIWFYLLPLAGAVLAMAAQGRVQAAFRAMSKVATRKGWSGAEVARAILDARGLHDVVVEQVPGLLTDHYDPRSHTLRLSEHSFHGRSVAAAGIAAHEAGHAQQHADAYAWLGLRSQLVPVVGATSRLAGPLVMFGFLMAFMGAKLATPILLAAAVVLTGVVVFSLVTLPVELDASRRAMRVLADGRILVDDELDGARKVLNAAAWTYVAAAAMAIIELLRVLILLAGRRS